MSDILPHRFSGQFERGVYFEFAMFLQRSLIRK